MKTDPNSVSGSINDIDSIINIKGFIPTLCHSLAGIANSDGPITLNEYGLIVATAKNISTLSDNPTLINIFALQGILNQTNLEQSLKELAQYQDSISNDTKESILKVLLPLIHSQKNSENILKQFTKIFDISRQNNRLFQRINQNLPIQLNFLKKQLSEFSPFSQHLSQVESFAWRYNDEILNDYIKKYQQTKTDDNFEKLNQQLQVSKQEVIESIKIFKQQVSLLCQENSSADQLTLLAKILYEQVEQRLIEIEKRAALQKDMFKEDVDEFIIQSVNEIELNLRQKLEVKDWTNKKVWEDIANSEPAKALSIQYDKLKIRYEKIFNLWNDEFSHFSNELSLTQKVILQGLEKQELSQLLQPPSPRLKALQKLDQASNLIVNTIKLASAGSVTIGGIAIATGVPTSLFLVGATTIGSYIISSPLGWAAIGTITLAGLYQYISNPLARRGKEIRNKRSLIEEALKKMIGYPEESHNEHMDYIVDNFRKTAEKNFIPLLQDTGLSVKMNQMQLEVINQISHSTINELESLQITN